MSGLTRRERMSLYLPNSRKAWTFFLHLSFVLGMIIFLLVTYSVFFEGGKEMIIGGMGMIGQGFLFNFARYKLGVRWRFKS